MLPAVKLNHKILAKPISKILAVILASSVWMAAPVLAFDSKSVLKMHTEINNMQVQVHTIITQDVNALNRIQAVEFELNNLRARLQLYENKLTETQAASTQNKLNADQVLQRPLEDPYSKNSPSAANSAPMVDSDSIVNMAQASPVPQAQTELNTVPEALRTAKLIASPKPKAFAAKELPESIEEAEQATSIGSLVMGLGSQAPDIMAFNEAKSYFDDQYYILSERKFNQFIQYYRGSTLVSNAYFWLGESYYMRENYAAAARVYYQGYRINKQGAKAPDNLFKLADSLLLLGNKSDACAAFYEVGRRYSQSHPQLSNQAQAAQKQNACL